MTTNRFILQYDETDWEFIKRVASRPNKGLIPDVRHEGAKFYIGIPQGREEQQVPKTAYTVRRDLAKIQKVKTNGWISQISESDCLQYVLKGQLLNYELGDRVRFQDRSLVVTEKHSQLVKRDGLLRHEYVLSTLRGSQQEKVHNPKLGGNSIPGTVIDVKSHYTKLHLHIDQQQDKETATWFRQPTYFTGGTEKGYGTMPERGEVLYLHFPFNYEEDNYVISSDGNDYDAIRQRIHQSAVNPEPAKPKKQTNAASPGKSRNPGQPLTDDTAYRSKQWFSPGNKSLLLDDHQVKMHTTGGAAQITLLDGGGIIVNGNGSLDLSAKKINVNPDVVGAEGTTPGEGLNIQLSAGETIAFMCEGSTIMVSGKDSSVDVISDSVRLESPENPMDIQVMSQDDVEILLGYYEDLRMRTQPAFRPDGTIMTADDKDVLHDYFMNYVYKEGNGSAADQYKAWRLENYGKNKKEKRNKYLLDSGEFVIKGNYSDQVTGLGVGGNIALGFTGADFMADLRDLFHNFTHWKWSWSHGGETFLNAFGLIPVVGVLKNIKYTDEVSELLQQANNADDLLKGLSKIKLTDEAGNPLSLIKRGDGSYELVDASGKTVKKFDDLNSVVGGEGVKIGKGNGIQNVARIPEIDVKFKRNKKHDSEEFKRQLKDQEDGINELTIDEFIANRDRYLKDGRALEGDAAQKLARKKALQDKIDELWIVYT